MPVIFQWETAIIIIQVATKKIWGLNKAFEVFHIVGGVSNPEFPCYSDFTLWEGFLTPNSHVIIPKNWQSCNVEKLAKQAQAC